MTTRLIQELKSALHFLLSKQGQTPEEVALFFSELQAKAADDEAYAELLRERLDSMHREKRGF